jgi:predicted  nucleic acid-binding Zn-ribbon protein
MSLSCFQLWKGDAQPKQQTCLPSTQEQVRFLEGQLKEAQDEVTALQQERIALRLQVDNFEQQEEQTAAQSRESQGRVATLQAEVDVARSQMQQLSQNVEKGMANAAELQTTREELRALEAEKKELRKELEKSLEVKAQYEEAHREEVQALEAEKVELCKELEKSLEVNVQNEKARCQVKALEQQCADLQDKLRVSDQKCEAVGALEAEKKGLRKELEKSLEVKAQYEVAQLQVNNLEQQCADLQEKLRVSDQKRRTSFSAVTRSLSDVTDTLANAESSWTPWKELNKAKQQLGEVQKQQLTDVDASVEEDALAYGA